MALSDLLNDMTAKKGLFFSCSSSLSPFCLTQFTEQSLKKVRPGTYTVSNIAKGYEKKEINEVVIKDGRTTKLDDELVRTVALSPLETGKPQVPEASKFLLVFSHAMNLSFRGFWWCFLTVKSN